MYGPQFIMQKVPPKWFFVVQPVTKNQIPNLIFFFNICCCCRNSKREETRMSFFRWIATTTKIKTSKFCILYLVSSHWLMQRKKQKTHNKWPYGLKKTSTYSHISMFYNKNFVLQWKEKIIILPTYFILLYISWKNIISIKYSFS